MDDAPHLPAVTPCPLPAPAETPEQRLLAAWLSGRSPMTLRAYSGDLEDFRVFAGAATRQEAAAQLLARGHGGANEQALLYRAALLGRRLSAATVNRRLAALRSLVSLANTLGLVPWELAVPSLKAQAYRDTRGPGKAGFKKLLEQASARPGPKALRDVALLHLLYDMALRRAEVCRLDVGDFDPEAGKLAVLGKGRSARELLTVPGPTRAALLAWLETRGPQPPEVPLFVTFGRGAEPTARLTGDGLHYLVRSLGEKAGVKARPHMLRHAGITRALDLSKGRVRDVMRYSRHKDLRTLTIYDDNRTDLGGEIARLVAEDAER